MTPFLKQIDKFVSDSQVILQEKEREKDQIWAKLDLCKAKEEKLRAIATVISDQVHNSYTQAVGKICEVITACIEAVYDRNFEFAIITAPDGKSKPVILEHVSPNQTITYEDISQDLGDGLKDVVMFGLHVMQWAFSEAKVRNTLVLDEPFSGLGVLSNRISPIIRQLCSEMGLQIIMTTHNALTAQDADKIFATRYEDKQTKITTISYEEAEGVLS